MNTSGTICRVHATRQSSTTSSPAFTCGEKLNKILSKALVKDGSIKHVEVASSLNFQVEKPSTGEVSA